MEIDTLLTLDITSSQILALIHSKMVQASSRAPKLVTTNLSIQSAVKLWLDLCKKFMDKDPLRTIKPSASMQLKLSICQLLSLK